MPINVTKNYYGRTEIEEIVEWAFNEAVSAEDFAELFDVAIEEDYGVDEKLETAYDKDQEWVLDQIDKYYRNIANAYTVYVDAKTSLWEEFVKKVHSALETARSNSLQVL